MLRQCPNCLEARDSLPESSAGKGDQDHLSLLVGLVRCGPPPPAGPPFLASLGSKLQHVQPSFLGVRPSGNILADSAFAGARSNAARQGFGVITSTAIPMRPVQLALKYHF